MVKREDRPPYFEVGIFFINNSRVDNSLDSHKSPSNHHHSRVDCYFHNPCEFRKKKSNLTRGTGYLFPPQTSTKIVDEWFSKPLLFRLVRLVWLFFFFFSGENFCIFPPWKISIETASGPGFLRSSMRSFSCGGAFHGGWCAVVVGRKLGGGCNRNMFGIFIPKLGEDFHPIWRCAYFSNGLVVQPPTRKSGEIFRDVTFFFREKIWTDLDF